MCMLEKDSKLNLYCLDLCAQLQIQCNHLLARSFMKINAWKEILKPSL